MESAIIPIRIDARLWLLAACLAVQPLANCAELQPPLEYRHLYTYGSRNGLHPPKVLNRRPAATAMGQGDFPWGIGVPEAVATDRAGRVWITDSGTNSVHVFDTATGGYKEIRRAGDAQLQQPAGIVADSAGRIYLSDSATGGVFVFDENGEFDHSLVPKRFGRVLENPVSLALSENGATIFVVDAGRSMVVALNREGEEVGTFRLPPRLTQPTCISVINNLVYVLGSFRHIVEGFTPSGRPEGELKWEGIRATGAFSFDVKSRRYFVADMRLMLVQVFAEDGVSLGSFGQRGEGVDQMQRVDSIHVDARGRVYLTDSLHGKVLVFSGAN